MHLDNKSFLILSSPFIVAGGLWMFTADSLVEGLGSFFEPVQQQQPSILKEKGQDYSFIIANKDAYGSLLERIKSRNENKFWISDRLYQPYTRPTVATPISGEAGLKAPPPLLKFGEGDITSSAPTTVLSVQMVLPQQNMAIINNHIMRVGQSIDGVKLLQVESSKVYIQTSKGSQWVKLFH